MDEKQRAATIATAYNNLSDKQGYDLLDWYYDNIETDSREQNGKKIAEHLGFNPLYISSLSWQFPFDKTTEQLGARATELGFWELQGTERDELKNKILLEYITSLAV